MRIDFSEPKCCNCFHCRILNSQESVPSNVIASSEPVNSKPVQALGHESVAVGSISTSSPVQSLGHDDSAATGSISTFSLGSQTPSAPPVITPVCSEPVNTLAASIFRSDVFGSPFQTTSGSGTSATSTSSITSLFQSSSPFGSAPAVTSVNSAPTTQAFGQTTCAFGCSPNSFGFAPAVTSVSSAPTQASGETTFGCSLFAAPTLGSLQAPVKASSGFGAFSDTTPPRLFGFANPFGQNIPIPPTGSYPGFPGYGVDYLPGSKPNPFGQFQNTTGGGFSIFANPKTSPPQPFGPLPSSSLSPPATFSSNPNTGFNPFRALTLDGDTGGMFMSVSASNYPYKSHEELRWEDYLKGNKGSRIFASPSGPGFSFSQRNLAFTGFGTQFPNSSVQRPHETAAVSSPASGCTACGATTSTSASGNWTFNGATLAPPSAATTSLPWLFYPMYGSVPMMFGTSPAAQVTTPSLQAYPVNGYILLPFAAMNLH